VNRDHQLHLSMRVSRVLSDLRDLNNLRAAYDIPLEAFDIVQMRNIVESLASHTPKEELAIFERKRA
jgi:hypothetical protein